MSRTYCTTLDAHELLHAVAMIASLREHDPGSPRIVAVCGDELSRLALQGLAIPGVDVVALHEVDCLDEPLLAARAAAGDADPLLALPTILLRMLERDPPIDGVAYVSPRHGFYSDPQALWTAAGNAPVALREHGPTHGAAAAGRYDPGLIVLRNVDAAHAALHDWRARSLEAARSGHPRTAALLDTWNNTVPGLALLRHPGLAIGPWNQDRYRLGADADGEPTVDGQRLVAYPYEGLRWHADGALVPGGRCTTPADEAAALYFIPPHAQPLLDALHQVRSVLPDFAWGIDPRPVDAQTAFVSCGEEDAARPGHRRGPAVGAWTLWRPARAATAAAAAQPRVELQPQAELQPRVEPQPRAQAPAAPRVADDRSYALNRLDRKLERYLDFDDGYYVELGANDGVDQSNTLYFERHRNWRGVLVEPTPHNYLRCRANRSARNRIHCAACVSYDYRERFVPIAYSNLMSTPMGLKSDIADPLAHANVGRQFLAPTDDVFVFGALAVPLGELLRRSEAPPLIDLLSLDVEGAELEVLQGIDHRAWRFRYLCIECRDLPRMDAYLSTLGYRFVEALSEHDYLFTSEPR